MSRDDLPPSMPLACAFAKVEEENEENVWRGKMRGYARDHARHFPLAARSAASIHYSQTGR